MLEDRAQRIAEQLLENESLTDNLDDSEATHLLDWGLAVARRLCDQTVEMDETQAEEYLYQPLKNLRRTMRRINRLSGAPSAQSPEMIVANLQAIFDAASAVPGLTAQMPEGVESVARLVQTSPPGDALAKILSYLTFTLEGNIEYGEEE